MTRFVPTHSHIDYPGLLSMQVEVPGIRFALLDAGETEPYEADPAECRRLSDPPATQTIPLVGWGTYDQVVDSIKCRTFGHVVRLAAPIVQEFHSDLFWDAKIVSDLLDANLSSGQTEYEFAVCLRHSGTHVSDVGSDKGAAISASINETSAFLFRFILTMDDRQYWHLTINTLVAPESVHPTGGRAVPPAEHVVAGH